MPTVRLKTDGEKLQREKSWRSAPVRSSFNSLKFTEQLGRVMGVGGTEMNKTRSLWFEQLEFNGAS